tara:strand:- start:188 stop:598 length:411 start_codon:yes stop_codon:yes gene_type:complete
MTKIHAVYEGGLRCKAVHKLSNSELITDAPLDNCGKGESFSPTDLIATAFITCVSTIMGIAAENSGIDICNFEITAEKKMSKNLPRRISEIIVDIYMKNRYSEKEKKIFQNAAETCPVHKSLSNNLKKTITFHWND